MLAGLHSDSFPDVKALEPGDALTIACLAAGDDDALADAFDRFGPSVYRSALSVLGQGSAAQDVVQDVFVELWSHPERFNPEAGTLRGFLVLLARRRSVDVLRSELRRIARQQRHHRLVPTPRPPSPCEQVTDADAASAVRTAVSMLPEGQRRVVELAYFQGLSCREVARIAGIPEGTAKSRLRLARAKLESVLDRQLLESS